MNKRILDITFSVQGYVKQSIFLFPAYDHLSVKNIQDLLNDGRLATSVQENEEVLLLSDGAMTPIARVVSVNNNLEYVDFVVGNPLAACSLCGEEVAEDKAVYVERDGDKPRPFCESCEQLKEPDDEQPWLL